MITEECENKTKQPVRQTVIMLNCILVYFQCRLHTSLPTKIPVISQGRPSHCCRLSVLP